MLGISFEGWCQIRLATNPDPTDEPRGVSGYSFALPGEPDLDRVIRFHAPVSPRSHGPEVGVFVSAVTKDGKPVVGHPLLHAPVNLLNRQGEKPRRPQDPNGPKFEARGYILTEPGDQPIDPFHIQVLAEDKQLCLRRKAVLWPEKPNEPIFKIPRRELVKFGSISFIMNSGFVAEAIGLQDAQDFLDYRRKRRDLLEADLAGEIDPVRKAALEKRIAELRRDEVDDGDRRVIALGGCETRNFPLVGQAEVIDPHDLLGVEVDAERPWRTEFWFGGWDVDALCSFVRGTLAVATRR